MITYATVVFEIETDDAPDSKIYDALYGQEVTLDLTDNDFLLDLGADRFVVGEIDDVEVG